MYNQTRMTSTKSKWRSCKRNLSNSKKRRKRSVKKPSGKDNRESKKNKKGRRRKKKGTGRIISRDDGMTLSMMLSIQVILLTI